MQDHEAFDCGAERGPRCGGGAVLLATSSDSSAGLACEGGVLGSGGLVGAVLLNTEGDVPQGKEVEAGRVIRGLNNCIARVLGPN